MKQKSLSILLKGMKVYRAIYKNEWNTELPGIWRQTKLKSFKNGALGASYENPFGLTKMQRHVLATVRIVKFATEASDDVCGYKKRADLCGM